MQKNEFESNDYLSVVNEMTYVGQHNKELIEYAKKYQLFKRGYLNENYAEDSIGIKGNENFKLIAGQLKGWIGGSIDVSFKYKVEKLLAQCCEYKQLYILSSLADKSALIVGVYSKANLEKNSICIKKIYSLLVFSAKIDHPYILSLLDFDEDDEYIFTFYRVKFQGFTVASTAMNNSTADYKDEKSVFKILIQLLSILYFLKENQIYPSSALSNSVLINLQSEVYILVDESLVYSDERLINQLRSEEANSLKEGSCYSIIFSMFVIALVNSFADNSQPEKYEMKSLLDKYCRSHNMKPYEKELLLISFGVLCELNTCSQFDLVVLKFMKSECFLKFKIEKDIFNLSPVDIKTFEFPEQEPDHIAVDASTTLPKIIISPMLVHNFDTIRIKEESIKQLTELRLSISPTKEENIISKIINKQKSKPMLDKLQIISTTSNSNFRSVSLTKSISTAFSMSKLNSKTLQAKDIHKLYKKKQVTPVLCSNKSRKHTNSVVQEEAFTLIETQENFQEKGKISSSIKKKRSSQDSNGIISNNKDQINIIKTHTSNPSHFSPVFNNAIENHYQDLDLSNITFQKSRTSVNDILRRSYQNKARVIDIQTANEEDGRNAPSLSNLFGLLDVFKCGQ